MRVSFWSVVSTDILQRQEAVWELIKLVDDVTEVSVTREFNRLLQKKNESVTALYARFSKMWKTYSFIYELAPQTPEAELLHFRQRLREDTDRSLRLHKRAGNFRSMESLLAAVKTIEAAEDIQDSSVNAVKEDRYKDRSGMGKKRRFGQKKPASDLKDRPAKKSSDKKGDKKSKLKEELHQGRSLLGM